MLGSIKYKRKSCLFLVLWAAFNYQFVNKQIKSLNWKEKKIKKKKLSNKLDCQDAGEKKKNHKRSQLRLREKRVFNYVFLKKENLKTISQNKFKNRIFKNYKKKNFQKFSSILVQF